MQEEEKNAKCSSFTTGINVLKIFYVKAFAMQMQMQCKFCMLNTTKFIGVVGTLYTHE